MVIRRINYLLVWLGCLLVFWAYRQWISWLVLVLVTILPLFSLLISLPAMFSTGIHFNMPTYTSLGTPCAFRPDCTSIAPAPLWQCKAELTNLLTGHRQQIDAGAFLPTDHCGLLRIKITEAYVYDYLGIFRRKLPVPREISLIVRPQPVAAESKADLRTLGSHLPDITADTDHSAPRPYVPGDSIRQIHWKLSRKTGKLIINEATGSSQSIFLQIKLAGTQAELDQKLGMFLWLGTKLADQHIYFDVECISATGSEQWHIQTSEDLIRTLDAILSRRCYCSLSNGIADEEKQQHKNGGR